MAKRVTGNTSTPTKITPSTSTIFPARVKEIILENQSNPEIFKENGEWSGIGTIFFSLINNSNSAKNPFSSTKAFPLFPNQKNYPLVNEVVYIISLPTPKIQTTLDSQKFYYFQPINIWNNNHHNAIPDPTLTPLKPNSQQQDYIETSAGVVRRVTDGSTEINLGNTFKENLNVKTLQPFEGDIIHEGRWGQSLRFGSTVKNSKIFNPWSQTGKDGDPLTIIRNAQFNDGKDPWIPQVEDINKEGSTIYFTSTQVIPIEVSSKSYKSYSTSPTTPDKFAGEQIILNSGQKIV
jgi:hypothetical protein